jgi:hypothetical protein
MNLNENIYRLKELMGILREQDEDTQPKKKRIAIHLIMNQEKHMEGMNFPKCFLVLREKVIFLWKRLKK